MAGPIRRRRSPPTPTHWCRCRMPAGTPFNSLGLRLPSPVRSPAGPPEHVGVTPATARKTGALLTWHTSPGALRDLADSRLRACRWATPNRRPSRWPSSSAPPPLPTFPRATTVPSAAVAHGAHYRRAASPTSCALHDARECEDLLPGQEAHNARVSRRPCSCAVFKRFTRSPRLHRVRQISRGRTPCRPGRRGGRPRCSGTPRHGPCVPCQRHPERPVATCICQIVTAAPRPTGRPPSTRPRRPSWPWQMPSP